MTSCDQSGCEQLDRPKQESGGILVRDIVCDYNLATKLIAGSSPHRARPEGRRTAWMQVTSHSLSLNYQLDAE
jgi:hypothetical protein